MMDRRRALMINPWIDTGFTLQGFHTASNTEAVYNSSTDSLRVHSLTNGTYRNAQKSFGWEPGYEYLVEYDLQYVKGTHKSAFVVGATVQSPNSGNIEQSQHVKYIYDTQSKNIDKFNIYCTWSTSTSGDCTVSNFTIKKRRIR